MSGGDLSIGLQVSTSTLPTRTPPEPPDFIAFGNVPKSEISRLHGNFIFLMNFFHILLIFDAFRQKSFFFLKKIVVFRLTNRSQMQLLDSLYLCATSRDAAPLRNGFLVLVHTGHMNSSGSFERSCFRALRACEQSATSDLITPCIPGAGAGSMACGTGGEHTSTMLDGAEPRSKAAVLVPATRT